MILSEDTQVLQVFGYPVIDDNINIEILDKDLRIDTYRSSGAGGQHVNTMIAVRITHLPTKLLFNVKMKDRNINKETCLNMLRARLCDFEIKKKRKKGNLSLKTRYRWVIKLDLTYYNLIGLLKIDLVMKVQTPIKY